MTPCSNWVGCNSKNVVFCFHWIWFCIETKIPKGQLARWLSIFAILLRHASNLETVKRNIVPQSNCISRFYCLLDNCFWILLSNIWNSCNLKASVFFGTNTSLAEMSLIMILIWWAWFVIPGDLDSFFISGFGEKATNIIIKLKMITLTEKFIFILIYFSNLDYH